MLMRIFILFFLLNFVMIFAVENNSQINYFQIYQENSNFENFRKAIEHYNSNLSQDKDNFESNLYLSYLYFMEMNRNLERLKNNFDVLDNRTKFSFANLLLNLGRYDESITYYEKLNQESPNWSCPWRHKGEALMKLNRFEEAEKALQKAIETREEHYDAYVMLAEVQKEMGKYREALQTLNKGFSYKGKDIEDSEDEVTELDVKFLHLELLKRNGKIAEYQNLKTFLEEKAPKDKRWEKINKIQAIDLEKK